MRDSMGIAMLKAYCSRSSQARTTACGLVGSASPISWPGVAKPLDQYGPAGATSSNAEDDGDFDLFGSDSEEEVR